MWEDIKATIFRLFKIKPKEKNLTEEQRHVEEYQNITKENFTAIFANTLSILAFSDSDIYVRAGKGLEENKRSEYLNKIIERMKPNIKQNIALGNGCGLIASIPYSVANGGKRKVYIDTVMKDRFFITGTVGDEITKCTVISDIQIKDNEKYLRWTDYSLEDGIYVIRQKATKNGHEVALDTIPEWAGIAPEIRIGNVERLPIGIYRCPTSNRRPKRITGVPITYGCKATLDKIADCLMQIEDEYKKKKVKVFADETLFGKEQKLSDLYVKLNAVGTLSGQSLIDIFDPAFRDTALYHRLDRLFALLEQEVGTSRGILTELPSGNITATETRRLMHQTFSLCDDIHENAEIYFKDLLYGVNVLCEYYNITPPGEYEAVFDWSYAMLEDTQATFNQMMQAKSVGAVETAEIRQFVKPGEALDEARERCEEIKRSNPTISQLVGE